MDTNSFHEHYRLSIKPPGDGTLGACFTTAHTGYLKVQMAEGMQKNMFSL